jgi:hypothetical protein
MRFVYANPTRAWPWASSHTATMEVAYRHYRDAEMCTELACDDPGSRVRAATASSASPR